MSADLLREAAAKMRERAEAATPSPWFFDEEQDENGSWARGDTILAPSSPQDVDRGADDVMELGSLWPPANTYLAASWHPEASMAFARWLDYMAENWDGIDPAWAMACQAARAYLGRDS